MSPVTDCGRVARQRLDLLRGEEQEPASTRCESTQYRCDELGWRGRNVQGLAQVRASRQRLTLLDDDALLKCPFIDRACLLTTFDASKVLVYWQRQQETVHFRIGGDCDQPATQIRKRRGCPPDVIDYKVAITDAPVVCNEQLDRRVQTFELVGRRRVCGGKTIPVQPHTGVDAFGERFGKCRFADSEWPV